MATFASPKKFEVKKKEVIYRGIQINLLLVVITFKNGS